MWKSVMTGEVIYFGRSVFAALILRGPRVVAAKRMRKEGRVVYGCSLVINRIPTTVFAFLYFCLTNSIFHSARVRDHERWSIVRAEAGGGGGGGLFTARWDLKLSHYLRD